MWETNRSLQSFINYREEGQQIVQRIQNQHAGASKKSNKYYVGDQSIIGKLCKLLCQRSTNSAKNSESLFVDQAIAKRLINTMWETNNYCKD